MCQKRQETAYIHISGVHTLLFPWKEREIPLVTGVNIDDWWGAPGKVLKQAECLWSSGGRQCIVGVFGFDWINPEPERKVESVRLRLEDAAVVALCAMAGEKAGEGK